MKARTLITDDYARAFEQVDAILMPASPTAAFKFGELSDPTQMYLSDLFTISINIAGQRWRHGADGFGRRFGYARCGPAGRQAVRRRAPVVLCSRGRARRDGGGRRLGPAVAPAFAEKGGELA